MKNLVLLVALSGALVSFTSATKKFKNPKNYVLIPSGTTSTENGQFTCGAFWMQDHEVTNFEYRTFLADLKKQGKNDEYQEACPDTTAWIRTGGFMESFQNLYFNHPAFDNYPVVNISKKGAELYCLYLTEQFRSLYGDQVGEFRLPTKYEWIHAAKANHDYAVYPWGHNQVRSQKGCLLANFRVLGDQNITTVNGEEQIVEDSKLMISNVDDIKFVTAPVKSYPANDFGLFDMSGNVAELVEDQGVAMGGHWWSTGHDIQVTSEILFKEGNPYVGFRPVLSYISSK